MYNNIHYTKRTDQLFIHMHNTDIFPLPVIQKTVEPVCCEQINYSNNHLVSYG